MGGGLMQLVAYGAQDIYLTGNPQITFFKVVYRRHTNFAMESVEQTLSGTSTVGASSSKATAVVSRNGDLLGPCYVTSSTASIEDGDSLVDEVEVEIGGQQIDRHYKEWMQVWSELSTPSSKAEGYKCMTGSMSSGYASTGTAGVNMVQIPLQFFFCNNPGLYLPLIALQYHEVKLKFTWGTSAAVGVAASVRLWCDYVYLDTDERRRFAQVSHEYLIEQVQRYQGTDGTSHTLTFNHPVKELIWTSPATNAYGKALLSLNGHDRFASQEEEYFQLRQPFQHHTAVPGANIPFSDRPQLLSLPIDSGTVLHAATAVAGTTGTLAASSLTYDAAPSAGEVTTFNALWKVGDIIEIVYGGNDGVDVEDTQTHTAVVTALTVPVAATSAGVVTFAPTWPAGLIPTLSDADGLGVRIVARHQDPLSRCSQFAGKINCYSFALKPEEHQPSGTCNFSRIDNAKLVFTTAPGAAFNVYAKNYNVLRIMSGMGGLAYSN
jgi:hypothetical protein